MKPRNAVTPYNVSSGRDNNTNARVKANALEEVNHVTPEIHAAEDVDANDAEERDHST